MNEEFRIKGRILDPKGKPLANAKVRAYDKQGVFIAGATANDEGIMDFTCGNEPKVIKLYDDKGILNIRDLVKPDFVGNLYDWGDLHLQMSPAEWHICGIVKDKMTGAPLPGLTVEVWDVDAGRTGTYYDPLGEDLTNSSGRFNVWFDGSVFQREASWNGEQHPDVLIKVKNALGVVIHETEVDQDVLGCPHSCLPYLGHKGKNYTIEIDYVTAQINMVGPVAVANIEGTGLVTKHNNIENRPFGGTTTLKGRIWGAKVSKWKLYRVSGFLDSHDDRFNGLGPTSQDPNGFTKIAEGTNKIWDGPIHAWGTSNLEGLFTVILVVWDLDGTTHRDTQLLYLHNTPITPPAQITSPAPGSSVSKAAGDFVDIIGTASDDYFSSYNLQWVGPDQDQTEMNNIDFVDHKEDAVVNDKLGKWKIANKTAGPYTVRLSVHDRTIRNDGADTWVDSTWNTLIITE